MTKPHTNRRATQDRARETQRKLMDATLDAISELGWHGATTRKISEKAGVSIGAQTNHYASKGELLVAALDRGREASERAGFSESELARLSLAEYLEQLGEIMLSGDSTYGTLIVEALAASRTDAALRDAFTETDRAWISRLTELALLTDRSAVPFDGAKIRQLVEATLYYLRGLNLQLGAHQDRRHLQQLFQLWLKELKLA
ncbi:MAG: TetR/AcrR family transcriptional regulator [Pseudomonadota bacterium]